MPYVDLMELSSAQGDGSVSNRPANACNVPLEGRQEAGQPA